VLPGRLGDGLFTHDVETGAKPWTHLSFHNDPNDFQFAIVADRTGGHRPGVFPAAVGKLNLLRPEFVLTVGVLYDGRITDGGFAGTATVATGRGDDTWTLELQIPWKDLGLDRLDPSSVMTMLLVRTRPQGPGATQAPPLLEGNHTPERFGFLTFQVEETGERIRLQE